MLIFPGNWFLMHLNYLIYVIFITCYYKDISIYHCLFWRRLHQISHQVWLQFMGFCFFLIDLMSLALIPSLFQRCLWDCMTFIIIKNSVVKSIGFAVRSKFESQLCHWFILWYLPHYLISLNSFPYPKMEKGAVWKTCS